MGLVKAQFNWSGLRYPIHYLIGWSLPNCDLRNVRDVPVVFHSQWFSSFLHGDGSSIR
jgi:hypothetical protein